MTRCKPGDLAYIVSATVMRNLGLIVRVEGATRFPGLFYPDGSMKPGPVWAVDKEIEAWNGMRHNFVCDCDLRPITPPANSVTDDEVAELYDPRELVLVTRERA